MAEKMSFLCKRYPEIRLMMEPAKTIMVDGAVIRNQEKYLHFRRTPIGGMFSTTNTVEADLVRNSPQFEEGLIVEVDTAELHKAIREAPIVDHHPLDQGGQGTKPGLQPPPAPAEEPPVKPLKAKGPQRAFAGAK